MPHFRIKKEVYSQIEARFRCAHENGELRRRIISDGRPAYYRQCIRCGHAGRAIAVKEAESELQGGAEALPFDDEMEHKWRAKKHAEYVKTYQHIGPRLREEYEAYIKSDDWAARRITVLERVEHVCQVCEHFPATQVHHILYERIGAELDYDLLAVCSFCHGFLHGREQL